MLLFRSVVFDIRSVLCFIPSGVHVTLIFDQLRLIFVQLYMLLFRSVVSFIPSVVHVTLIFDQSRLIFDQLLVSFNQ